MSIEGKIVVAIVVGVSVAMMISEGEKACFSYLTRRNHFLFFEIIFVEIALWRVRAFDEIDAVSYERE